MIDIQGLLQGWCDLWGVSDLAPEISVELSSRMTRSLGRCYQDRKLIRIARFVQNESEDLFQEVLCHEAAHVVAYHLDGKSIRPHGREWKSLMREAGYPTSARYQGTLLSNLPPRARRTRPANSLLGSLRAELARKVRGIELDKRFRLPQVGRIRGSDGR